MKKRTKKLLLLRAKVFWFFFSKKNCFLLLVHGLEPLECITPICYARRHEHRPSASNELAQFLVWEDQQDLHYEFDGFAPIAMTGVTIAHDEIIFDRRAALAARLAFTPCRPLGPNIKIIIDGRVRYPDAIVVCHPVSPTATVAADLVVVFEGLNEGSSQTDLIEKNREYRATPTIQRYVVLQQAHKAAIVFVRREDGWLSEIVSGDNAILDFPELGITFPLREVYANVELSEVRSGEAPL